MTPVWPVIRRAEPARGGATSGSSSLPRTPVRWATTWLDAAGVPPKVASVLMGHATPARQPGAAPITLARYTHALPEDIGHAREAAIITGVDDATSLERYLIWSLFLTAPRDKAFRYPEWPFLSDGQCRRDAHSTTQITSMRRRAHPPEVRVQAEALTVA